MGTTASPPKSPTDDHAPPANDTGKSARPSTATAAAAAAEHATVAAGSMKLLNQWLIGIKTSHVGHARAAVVYDRRAKLIGVATTLISAIVGTTLFSAIATSTNSTLITIAAVLSVAAVILSALQTFLNYGQLAASHHTASIAYGALRRRTELITVFEDPADLKTQMPLIADAWKKLELESPDLPLGIFEYARKWVSKRAQSNEKDEAGY